MRAPPSVPIPKFAAFAGASFRTSESERTLANLLNCCGFGPEVRVTNPRATMMRTSEPPRQPTMAVNCDEDEEMARKPLAADQLLRLDNQICFAVYSAAH